MMSSGWMSQWASNSSLTDMSEPGPSMIWMKCTFLINWSLFQCSLCKAQATLSTNNNQWVKCTRPKCLSPYHIECLQENLHVHIQYVCCFMSCDSDCVHTSISVSVLLILILFWFYSVTMGCQGTKHLRNIQTHHHHLNHHRDNQRANPTGVNSWTTGVRGSWLYISCFPYLCQCSLLYM